jgi:hypothetical protein
MLAKEKPSRQEKRGAKQVKPEPGSPAPQDWAAAADGWHRLGADMVMLYPMYRISNFDGHIETLRRFKEVASG